MVDPVSFLLLILLAAGLSQAIRPDDPTSRLFWTCTPGLLLLFAVHPLALLFALASFAASGLVYLVGRRIDSPRINTRLPYSILLLLPVPDLAADPVLMLGSAFFVIRQMMTVAAALKERRAGADVVAGLLLATFFFGALPCGPVFNGLRVWEQLQARRTPRYTEGLLRVFEGFVYSAAFAGFASALMRQADILTDALVIGGSPVAYWALRLVADPLLAFGLLFATFYGYSRMAEGTALLFACEVPENFDKPHLARDLADFWKRWHRSMADFVMQYIYLPLLVATSRAKFAMVAAFVCMGLWHDFTPGFLIWGLGHGIGLGVVLPWARRNVPASALRWLSLGYVVVLSTVAHGVWH